MTEPITTEELVRMNVVSRKLMKEFGPNHPAAFITCSQLIQLIQGYQVNQFDELTENFGGTSID